MFESSTPEYCYVRCSNEHCLTGNKTFSGVSFINLKVTPEY